MKVFIPHIGELILGRNYEVTFSDGKTGVYQFTGVKLSPYDGNYTITLAYFGSYKKFEIGYMISNIALMDETSEEISWGQAKNDPEFQAEMKEWGV